jgi:hypothetical protein
MPWPAHRGARSEPDAIRTKRDPAERDRCGQNGGVSVHDTPSTPPTMGKPQYPRWLWLVVLAVVVVVGVTITILAFLSEGSDNRVGDPAIEQFIPTEGDKIFQQEPVGIDLAPGYDGTLALNGTRIPDDQLTKVPALNIVQFVPGPGKDVEQYDQGQNCVLATYWLSEDGPGVATSRSWCFTVL